MPTRKTQFFPGEFYHIYNRGNAKQDIFYNDRDRYRFLQAICLSNNINSLMGISELERTGGGYTLVDIKNFFIKNKIESDPFVKIFADCLMPNHFHFIIQELKGMGVTNFMQRLGNSYARYFTIKYNRPGSLFQGRFKAVHIKTEDQLKYLLAYVNVINPAQLIAPKLKEKGIEDFEKVWNFVECYNWSTHQEFLGKRDSIIVDSSRLFKRVFSTTENYSIFTKNVLQGKENKMWASIGELTID
jgi:putative transposase